MRGMLKGFSALFVVLLSVSNVPIAKGQPGVFPFNPTHYWTYHLFPGTYRPDLVIVKDQFYPQGVTVTVDSLTRLLNWVQKNNSPVPDSMLHYTWWNIREKLPVQKDVLVTNQFGSHPVRVVNLEFLLVPAYKNFQSPIPPRGDHFLCYRAFGFPPPGSGYDLLDEWRVDHQFPGPLEYLCAPCSKQHAGALYSVQDTVTHLAAYPVQPFSGNFAPVLYDQFLQGSHLVSQIPLEYLFVPSEKTGPPTETKRSTWGRLKSLYR